jgi:lipopolysaccharide assembly outer membrane protein LptD (OstA)
MLLLVCGALPYTVSGQMQPQESEWTVESSTGRVEVDMATGLAVATNGVLVKYGNAVLTAQDRVAVNYDSGEVVADGKVRIQQGEQVWVSEHLRYNFKTRVMAAEQFRTGQNPFFASGSGLSGDYSNRVYSATNAMVTSDDISRPFIKVRAKRVVIIPNEKIKAYDATVYVGEVPVFYFPYYTRNIGPHANNFNFMPGYRNLYGPFLLSDYTWYYNDQLDGVFHFDYRWKRGPGVGPDLNYHLGKWGDGTLRYYYTHDEDPDASELRIPIPEDRQRVSFTHQANPATNLYLKTLVQYETDPAVVRDFFVGEYRRDIQPKTFFEANKFWDNFSVDLYVQPQLNTFLETVERLPDLRLTGYRQQLGATPLYYESESSAGYYRRSFAEGAGPYGAPPGLDYEAGRVDTYHQIVMPETFFGWLNVTPRVGGRYTYYGSASGPGGITDDESRGVFNTGAEVSFKASRLWRHAENKFFEVDGLRHIIEPSANYVFVPEPSVEPQRLPQFDYELPSLRLLPLEFPDYNAIDSIDSQNAIRWGLRNKLQTKRDGMIQNLVEWDLYTDWRLDRRSDQTTFSDLYSDLVLRPKSWLTLESLVRYDIEDGDWRMSYNTFIIQPNNIWSWRFGHYYLRDDIRPSPTALGVGNNVFASTMTYRLNENYGFRMSHYFDAESGELREQAYTIYRDLRSWTAALAFLIRDNPVGGEDFSVAFTFSLKAFPRVTMGGDLGGPYSLLGN